MIVALGIAVRLSIGDKPIEYDSANYAYVATQMAERGVSPLAFFNNKPPGIYYWYQLFFALFGDGSLACHLTSTIPDLIALLTIATIGRRLVSARVGEVAAAIYASLQPAVRLAGYGYTESPLTACLLAAGAIMAKPRMRGSTLGPVFLAGLLVGLATLFKQPAYLLGVVLALWGLSRAPSWQRPHWILAFACGVLVVQVALVAWLIRHDALGEFVRRVFVQGVRHGYADGLSAGERLHAWFSVAFAPMPVLMALGLISLTSRRGLSSRGFASTLVAPTVVIGCFSYEFYDHYLIPALPALSLIVAEWLLGLEPRWLRRVVAGCLAITHGLSLLVFTVAGPEGGTTGALDVWRPRPLSLGYQLRVAAYVAESTGPGEPILSTGSDIPYLAHRRNAYRYLGIAPYLRRLDATGFDDFPAAADRVRILVLERWRMTMLPHDWVASLDSPGGVWTRVVELDHPEFVIYRRAGMPPTIDNP